jgi:thioredoxin reductase
MHDVIIIGGSYAGLSAGLQLARARKRVLVVDAGLRRNRFADHSHGFLGQDGRPPQLIAQDAKAQLLAYPTVSWVDGEAADAGGALDGFRVTFSNGGVHEARRLVLATGVVDVLPPILGLEAQWGAGAMTCPYCHGYELNGGDVAVIATSPMSVHHAMVIREWGPTTLFLNGLADIEPNDRRELDRRGIAVEATPIQSIDGERGAPLLNLADGRARAFAGVFVTTTVRYASPVAERLGCEFSETPVGRLIKVDAMQATSVPGVFACGDAASAMASIALSSGSGAMAGAATHRSLIFPPASGRQAA